MTDLRICAFAVETLYSGTADLRSGALAVETLYASTADLRSSALAVETLVSSQIIKRKPVGLERLLTQPPARPEEPIWRLSTHFILKASSTRYFQVFT